MKPKNYNVQLTMNDEQLAEKQNLVQEHLAGVIGCLHADDTAQTDLLLLLKLLRDSLAPEKALYFYHPDHLGSSSWITYTDGKAIEHLHYLPYGETQVDQRATSYAARYTFSAKEKDEETGYSYFGARYYSSDLSVWLSVDPMADKYPSLSPYAYCANNPVKLMDPDGEDVITVEDDGHFKITEKEGNDILVSSSGKSVELSGNGVFKHAYKESEQNNPSTTTLEGMNSTDAKRTFNFMADNTDVEWGYMEEADGNGNVKYLVGSEHSSDAEGLVYGKACEVKPGNLIRYDHNHLRKDDPFTASFPSTPKCAANPNSVDTDAWNYLLKTQPNARFGIRYRGKTDTWVNDKNHGTDNSIRKYLTNLK